MAKKSIKATDLNLEKLRKQIAEMEANREKQIPEAVIRVFGPIFKEESVCDFYDEQGKNKNALLHIQERVSQLLFQIIDEVENGTLVFETTEKEESSTKSEKVEKSSSEEKTSSEEKEK